MEGIVLAFTSKEWVGMVIMYVARHRCNEHTVENSEIPSIYQCAEFIIGISACTRPLPFSCNAYQRNCVQVLTVGSPRQLQYHESSQVAPSIASAPPTVKPRASSSRKFSAPVQSSEISTMQGIPNPEHSESRGLLGRSSSE